MPINIEDKGSHLRDETLQEFEARLGNKLLDDYYEFLAKTNGGRPIPSIVDIPPVVKGDPIWTQVTFFYRLVDDVERKTLLWTWNNWIKRHPPNLLPFGQDIIGSYFCISLGASDRGSVFYHNYYGDGSSHLCDYENCYLLANSFTGFLGMLRERTPDDKDP